jgi:transposase InsO family protein
MPGPSRRHLAPALRVVRKLGQIIESRGCPRMTVSDNGTEFPSNAILAWQEGRCVLHLTLR